VTQYATTVEFQTTGLKPAAMTDEGGVSVDPGPFLLQASGTIDSYLRPRYSLPLTSTPYEIKRACIVLARWDFLVFLGISEEEFDANYRLEYERVIKWLEMISAGTLQLDGYIDQTPGSAHEGATAEVWSRDERGWYDEPEPDSCEW
jgi:phage gp36-like protein